MLRLIVGEPTTIGLGAEDLRHHVVPVRFGEVVELHGDLRVGLADPRGDVLGHDPRPVPHRVVDDRDLVFLVVVRPFQVLLDDLHGVRPAR